MAGISDKAVKTQYAQNKYRYNKGDELQNQEFTDGSGLECYDAVHRIYDPQIGRFWQIDRLGEIANSFSPYSFAVDNPMLFNDPLGDTTTLPSVTVTALDPNSLTAQLNKMNFGGVDAWVGMMMTKYHHSGTAIDDWALRNRWLNHDTREWILNGTTDASVKYRKIMDDSWKAQGKLYKFFLSSALTGSAGELFGVADASVESVALEDAGEDAGEDVAEESVSVYHKGELNGGNVSSTRPLSTGTDRSAVEALNRPGQVWEFKIPSSKMFEWKSNGLAEKFIDLDKATGVMNDEIRFSSKLASDLNNYLIK